MSETKGLRPARRQLGQFFTPLNLARRLVQDLPLDRQSKILEPSFGDGAFIVALVERLAKFRGAGHPDTVKHILRDNLHGVEIDPVAYQSCMAGLRETFAIADPPPNLSQADFFKSEFRAGGPYGPLFGADAQFDLIVGNPPFGGTIDPTIQDPLDARFGKRDGHKIKKETYSFFIVKCVELLRPGGRLRFICSDTFLTIPTMMGLREFLLNRGDTSVRRLAEFSDDTAQPMVVLDFHKTGRSDHVSVDGVRLARTTIDLTGNRSWRISPSLTAMFNGPKLGDYVVASSGMTVGRNELFVREIVDGQIVEPFQFEFFEAPITLARELERARLGALSAKQQAKIRDQEARGETRRNVRVVPLGAPLTLRLPHPDYRPYNKASSELVYTTPQAAIYWRDEGDAVITFKKNGNWYLHGVGGQPYFGREGLTWQLVAPALNVRYLPPGYILDSGAPCAFLREGVPREELWFILGWALTPLATRLMKEVLNHTRNIQSKDLERLPYPYWASPETKVRVVERVQELVRAAMAGARFERDHPWVVELGGWFAADAPWA